MGVRSGNAAPRASLAPCYRRQESPSANGLPPDPVDTVQLYGKGGLPVSAKSDRVEARVSPDQRDRIGRAAAFAGESMSAFIVSAAVQRADEVIAEQSSTVVPSDYFDQLLGALDEAAEPSPRLAIAAKRAHRRSRIRSA
jgi:uncharacterized protein (DUF1778 family)